MLEYLLAKKKVLNESGNMIMVVVLITMISSFIAYWISVSTKVDKETRTLDSTKRTAYLRSDFKNTIHRSLEGNNALCPQANLGSLKDKFHNFARPVNQAIHEETFLGHNSILADGQTNVKCYFNPARYTQLAITSENQIEFLEVKVKTRRTTEPNYSTLSNFISTDILVRFKLNKKENVLKYQLKYRIDVLDLSRFGLIFKNTTTKLFELASPKSRVKVNALSLFDHPDRVSAFANPMGVLAFPLSYLLNLPDTSRLIYNRPVYLAANQVKVDSTLASNFLKNQTLYSSFRAGISTNRMEGIVQAPYDVNLDQWEDMFDYKEINDFYPLPKTSSPSMIWNVAMQSPFKTYSQTTDLFSTAYIYSQINSGEGKKSLTQSCKNANSLSAEPYPLFIFKDFTKDFTIDFTANNSTDWPPVFCGLIIARNLIIKLNNSVSTAPVYHHHIIGKFILSGKIRVENDGQLFIHDLLHFTEDQVQYSLEGGLDATNLRTQMYNQKFYSTQNFMLPFFRDTSIYNTVSSDTERQNVNNLNRFYVPRSTKSFFNVSGLPNCASNHLCRVANIPSPPLDKLLIDHWRNLVFEVYDVE